MTGATPIQRPLSTMAGGSARISVQEIAERLSLGKFTVYSMLEKRILPGIRLGHRWIVTRYAYALWEQTCGISSSDEALKKAA